MENLPKVNSAEKPYSDVSTLFEQVLNEPDIDREVQTIDPLNADDFLINSLPQLNVRGDTIAIIKQLDKLLLEADDIKNFSIIEGRAALRDLGHLAASLRRHSIDIDTLPRLKENLLLLGNLIDEVPRDTVFSYGPRNPDGERQRKFTNLNEETFFIESFKSGMKDLYKGADLLLRANKVGPLDLEWGKSCEMATAAFEHMVSSIRTVRENLPPEIFTNNLRPYFEPIILNNQTYFAPGGAQMPVLLFDQIIWGSDSKDSTYASYKIDNISYSPSSVRKLFSALDTLPSLLTLLLSTNEVSYTVIRDSNAQALLNLLNSILRFRAPHRKVANDNFALRPEMAIGSGGYSPNILNMLIEKTTMARGKLIELVTLGDTLK